MATRKKAKEQEDDLRSEYDIAALGKGVRGKYYKAAIAGLSADGGWASGLASPSESGVRLSEQQGRRKGKHQA